MTTSQGTQVRIIPALAGNTAFVWVAERQTKDHPRSRGEYVRRGYRKGQGMGSSPLSRGIRCRHPETRHRFRIIPALAGNTSRGPSSQSENRDHPRSRGEYSHRAPGTGAQVGSSPLSRGIRYTLKPGMRGGGIIPALAGNTRTCSPRSPERPDHPRSRGEYAPNHRQRGTATGSSPLSRGIPKSFGRGSTYKRIIPALAGNTQGRNRRTNNSKDHPRSRGEYMFAIASAVFATGSSPLSRGIR